VTVGLKVGVGEEVELGMGLTVAVAGKVGEGTTVTEVHADKQTPNKPTIKHKLNRDIGIWSETIALEEAQVFFIVYTRPNARFTRLRAKTKYLTGKTPLLTMSENGK